MVASCNVPLDSTYAVRLLAEVVFKTSPVLSAEHKAEVEYILQVEEACVSPESSEKAEALSVGVRLEVVDPVYGAELLGVAGTVEANTLAIWYRY